MIDPLESFAIFPIHLNSNKSYSEGRRYSKTLSVANPTCKEIKLALESLNIKYSDDLSKRHPQEQNEMGVFRIDKSQNRKETIKNIVNFIRELREKRMSEGLKGTTNTLNLIPKKKSKKSKN